MSKRKFQHDTAIMEALEVNSYIESVDDSDFDPNYDPMFGGFSSDEEEPRNIQKAEIHLDSQLGVMAMENDEEFERRAELIVSTTKWTEFRGKQKNFDFTGREGKTVRPSNLDSLKPADVFNLIIDDNLLKLLAAETNRYAKQTTEARQQASSLTPSFRHGKWLATTTDDIKTFLGFMPWMGFDQKGTISSYWSTLELYKSSVSRKMTLQITKTLREQID